MGAGDGPLGPIIRLDNPVRDYAWGSRTAIAQLQGRPTPSARPEAELWIGTHPAAPSWLADDGALLTDVIAAAPRDLLGDAVVDRFGPRLPFLLKVLAADAPLSLQAHPSAEQAAAGFAAEEAAGVPIDAPERAFRDPWPKPELLCALSPFVALCGFRPVEPTIELLDTLAVDDLDPVTDALRAHGAAGLGRILRDLLTLPTGRCRALVGAVAEAARALAGEPGDFSAEASAVARLAAHYPTDPGVAVALLLNLVELEPGEAIQLPAGKLHSYLEGVGIEVMGTSDNVLRGGLTTKHVDVEGLLEVADVRAASPAIVAPAAIQPGELAYVTPTPQFRLSRLEPAGATVTLDRRGPDVLLCVEGEVTVTADEARTDLPAGEALLVAASAHDVAIGGDGTAFRATPGALA